MIEAGHTFAEALAVARKALADSPTPQLDARVLLEHVAGLSRAEMIAADSQPVGPLTATGYTGALERRRAGEPVAYITGRQEFWGRTFSVGPGVLIPRPESEMLVEAALEEKADTVLDLGTGSGCLLLSVLAEKPNARGVGIDRSADALAIAERNRKALKLDDRARLERMSFADAPIVLGGELFEIVLANPPYITSDAELPVSVRDYEPPEALFAGEDGCDAHREVAASIARVLSPHGFAFIEIGYDQRETAEAIYAAALPGFEVRTHMDGQGHPRMVAVRPKARL